MIRKWYWRIVLWFAIVRSFAEMVWPFHPLVEGRHTGLRVAIERIPYLITIGVVGLLGNLGLDGGHIGESVILLLVETGLLVAAVGICLLFRNVCRRIVAVARVLKSWSTEQNKRR